MRTLGHGLAGLLTAAALMAGIGAVPALAAALALTITPGGSFTGTGKLTVPIGQASISCKSSITGTLASGVVQGDKLGSISSVKKCTGAGPLGTTLTITFSAGLGSNSWPMVASAFRSGVVSGEISNIKATVSATGCTATIAGNSATSPGSIPFTFNGSTLDFLKGGDLHIWNVSGCFGLIADGDTAELSASYAITPKQTITNP